MPPAPTRIDVVAEAMWPMRTAVAALAIESMLWCSANQMRSKAPVSSALRASVVLSESASPTVWPLATRARSRTERRGWACRRWYAGSSQRRYALSETAAGQQNCLPSSVVIERVFEYREV